MHHIDEWQIEMWSWARIPRQFSSSARASERDAAGIRPPITYRPEVDGLRAIAVLPVILFHGGFAAFAGGFVGVDVFFVISGYVITATILPELEGGDFSIVNFYERRVRRILPALLFVMAACLPVAWLLLLPQNMDIFLQSLAAASLFETNILFRKTSGYFSTGAELNPLLHTWSLAVEGQFYLVFPLFMSIAWRGGRRCIVATLALAAIGSLVWGHWGSLNHPIPAFYLLPSRAWEFLIGALVAFHLRYQTRSAPGQVMRELGGLSGIVLIVAAIALFDTQTPTPSLYTLVPTMGAVLILIFAGRGTLTGTLLASRPLVLVGLISYSAYLWHQPLFAFARNRSLVAPDDVLMAGLAILALVLAYFTWQQVEKPFRTRLRHAPGRAFGFAAAATMFFVLVGFGGHAIGGDFYRGGAGSGILAMERRLAVNRGLGDACDHHFTRADQCRTSDAPEIVVWGDSFAMHLVQGLVASNGNVKVVQHTVSGCGPFLDVAPVMLPNSGLDWAKRCIEFNDSVLEYLRQSRSVKYVVLSARFGKYVDENARIMTRTGAILSGHQESYAYFEETLRRIREIGMIPVIVSSPPASGYNTGQCLLKAQAFGVPHADCDFSLETYLKSKSHVMAFLRRLDVANKVVWLSGSICPEGRCNASAEGMFVYRDSWHLSREGSAWLGRRINLYDLIVRDGAELGEPHS